MPLQHPLPPLPPLPSASTTTTAQRLAHQAGDPNVERVGRAELEAARDAELPAPMVEGVSMSRLPPPLLLYNLFMCTYVSI
jgi:hypothetical protein